MSEDATVPPERFELHLDGQTAGRFAAARGLESDDADSTHLPGLRRAITVTLEDGYLEGEYGDWLEYGRNQVGKHGEIVGPDAGGAYTRWLFEEGWPTGVVRTGAKHSRRLALASLRLEIEGVMTTTAPPAAPAVSPPLPAAGRARGFWKRLLGRR